MSSDNMTSNELFSWLFEACNIMRGPINQDEYKSYITPLLFYKRVSDNWDEEYDLAMKESDGDTEYAEFPEMHVIQIPKGCHWEDVRNATSDIGSKLVNAMNGIERANQATLGGLFSSFDDANWTDKNRFTDGRLKDLIEHMSEKRLRNSDYSADIMGDAYEFLLKKFADMQKKNAGEFFTPRSIVTLLIWLLDPQPGDSIYDPACGTGGMLIEALKYMGNEKKQSFGKVYGQEKNLSTSAIARMNVYLHGEGAGDTDVTITQGDTLRHPNYLENGRLKTFNAVVANPPFSLKNWGADSFETDPYGRNLWGCPTDSNADFAWLQHMVKSMNPDNGKVAVVLPQGVLFRTGKDGKMRQKLVETDLLECIISLAGGLFYNAGVSACILFLNNHKRPEHQGKVCMIDAAKICTPERAQNTMTEQDITEVFNLYSKYEPVIEKCAIINIDEIRNKEFTLTANNYIEREKAEVKDPAIVRQEYFDALKQVEVAEEKMKKLLIQGGYIDEQNHN